MSTAANDYVLFGDHWQAYSVNELTKYIPDNQNYWDYAMAIAPRLETTGMPGTSTKLYPHDG